MAINPLVTIVLPSYNGEKYLEGAINSCLMQTYNNLELILVDDCSTDATPEIMARAAARDGRVRVIRNNVNKKLPASLNVGFKYAEGQLFTWTSDDNLYAENAIETLVSYLASNAADIVYSDLRDIDESGVPQKIVVKGRPSSLLYSNAVGACFLYKSEVHEKLGGYDETLFLVEDYDFWYRAYIQGFSFYKINIPLYFYRLHGDSLSSRRGQLVAEATLDHFLSHRGHLSLFPAREHGKFWYKLYMRSREAGRPLPAISVLRLAISYPSFAVRLPRDFIRKGLHIIVGRRNQPF